MLLLEEASVSVWWCQYWGQGLISELIISLTSIAINTCLLEDVLEHLSRVFFPSVSYRWDCPEKLSFTEEIPDENKSEGAVQSTSSGCNQPEHDAPICINIHWAHVAFTERWVWHTLDVLASLRYVEEVGSSHDTHPSCRCDCHAPGNSVTLTL